MSKEKKNHSKLYRKATENAMCMLKRWLSRQERLWRTWDCFQRLSVAHDRPSETPVSRFNAFSDLHRHQGCTMCTYVHAGKKFIHIKLKLRKNATHKQGNTLSTSRCYCERSKVGYRGGNACFRSEVRWS